MAEKTAEKLVLFNHSRNPYHLKNGPDGEKRIFAVGSSLECADKEEYDMLKNYRGVSTTQQAAPGLSAHIEKLNADKAALTDEVASLKEQLEKFQDHKKGK